jgi:hypothetical protein
MAATFGGLVTANVGSAIWGATNFDSPATQIAASIGAGSSVLSLIVGVNIHGPRVILMFLVLFSVINVLTLLGFDAASRERLVSWR